jgi:hypothetical protein
LLSELSVAEKRNLEIDIKSTCYGIGNFIALVEF